MNLTLFGSGYVGLVSGTCFANAGHNVTCVDNDEQKITDLKSGTIPIYEPGLSNLVIENQQANTLSFTSSAKEGIDHAEVIFIAVGTPPDEDGSADLKYVLQVASAIGQYMNDDKIIIVKSTVPVGTCDKVAAAISTELAKRNVSIKFYVVSNPEFLKEGSAISDFQKPDRIVIGTDSDIVRKKMVELYAPFNRNHNKIIFMDVRSSELTKYAANAMLATKISFMNEMANLAEKLGADIEHVRHGIGSDSRIGFQFIYPGCGYGGSCFPKDVKALTKTAEQIGRPSEILSAVERVNTRQKTILFEKLASFFNGDLANKTIAVWGLAFKPNTDDVRDAPSITFLHALKDAGAKVQAFDPEAMDEMKKVFPEWSDLQMRDSKEAVLEGADALVICTEWRHFWAPNFDSIKSSLKHAVIIDGRNLYDPKLLEDYGFHYAAIGRGKTD